MRVFVTGASGWIGSAVVPELIGAGHQVVGLARSDASAAALAAAGAEVHRGTLDDLDGLRAAAAASDGVIHLAFKHDVAFSGDFAGRRRRGPPRHRDLRRRRSRAPTGRSSSPPGLAGLTPGRGRDRATTCRTRLARGHRGAVRRAPALALAARGVRSSVVRLPPTVHGDGRPRLRRDASSASRARRASRATSATAPTAGPPCTGSTPRASSAWRWRRRRPDRCCTRVAERGRAAPRRRRGDRAAARPAGGVGRPRGRGRALRLARRLPRAGQSRPRAR